MEIVTDSNFAELGKLKPGWTVTGQKGVVVQPVVQAGVLQLEISEAKGANWHGELTYSPFPVAAGETFVFSCSARARVPFKFSVWLGQENSPYASLVSKENHFGEKVMGEDWQDFAHTWRAERSEKAARLNFVLGPVDNRIEIKEVSLQRGSG